jgi:CheY-like chemotaxis protein
VTSRILARPADLSVVVVDDEPSVRLTFTRMLQRLGVVRIESAANAADALQAITTPGRRVDLVICDLSMPTADGLLCLRWLADLERPPAVILVSGHERLLLESARRLGESLQLRILGAEQKPVPGPCSACSRAWKRPTPTPTPSPHRRRRSCCRPTTSGAAWTPGGSSSGSSRNSVCR